MKIEKVITVKLEDLLDLKPLIKALETSLPLFKDNELVKEASDLLTYKVYSSSYSARNNLFTRIEKAAPKVKKAKVKEIEELRKEEGNFILALHDMPADMAIRILKKSEIEFDYIEHSTQKDSVKKMSIVGKDTEFVEFGKEKPEKKKAESKPKKKKKEEPKPKPPIDAEPVDIKLEEVSIEEEKPPIEGKKLED